MPTNVPGEHAMTLDRARLLRRAAAGAAALGMVGMAGATDALAHDRDDDDHDHHRRESPGRIVDALATAESFGVTFLTEAIRRAPGTPSEPLVDTLKAANTAEFDHVVVLRQLGGRQFTLRFWIPEAAFGGGGVGLFESIEIADTIELQGYLTATTAFARGGRSRPARWMAEACGVEAEHRAIARFAQTALGGRQQISIDRSFEPWGIRTAHEMIASLEANGIGFGRQGATPGAFYEFPGDPVANGVGLVNNGRFPDEPDTVPPA